MKQYAANKSSELALMESGALVRRTTPLRARRPEDDSMLRSEVNLLAGDLRT